MRLVRKLRIRVVNRLAPPLGRRATSALHVGAQRQEQHQMVKSWPTSIGQEGSSKPSVNPFLSMTGTDRSTGEGSQVNMAIRRRKQVRTVRCGTLRSAGFE